MKASNYIPELYKSNLEMNVTVGAYEDELENNLKPSVDNKFKDEFILVATENGIEKYEKIFKIQPDPYTEDIEFRRSRILNRLISKIPFTERFLQSQLDRIVGVGNWEYDIDYNDYTLDIDITTPGRAWLRELNELLTRVIPCNIEWTINVFAASWQAVKENFETWDDLTDKTWQEVLDGEWLS